MHNEVFFLESNLTGYGAIGLQLAQLQGYRTHFLTRRPDEYESLKPNPVLLAHQVSIVDTYDMAKLLHFFADKQPLAVVAFDDYRLLQASLISEHLGLPHANVDGLINVRFKDRARMLTQGLGFPIAYDRRPLGESGPTSSLGYPCVVKPIDDSGSTGVRICYNDEDYRAAFAHIRGRLTNLRGYRIAELVLVEEFVDGPEYTAEVMWNSLRGQWQLLGYTKKLMAAPPYRVEQGAIFPYSFGDELDGHIERVVYSWLEAVGHRYGAAHVEFKVVDGKPALMEINPRLGGDQIRDLMLHTRGFDSINLYLHLYVQPGEDILPGPANGGIATSFYMLPPRTGQIRRVIPPAEPMPGILRSHFSRGPLTMTGITDNDDRLGYVIAHANNLDLSLAYAESFVQQVAVEYVS